MIALNIALWLVLPAVAAGALAFALTPLTARLAVWLGAIDMPGYRKTHSTPLRRVGGLALVTARAGGWVSQGRFGAKARCQPEPPEEG